MGFTMAGCAFRYHFMLALMAVDAEEVVMFTLVCSQHAELFLMAAAAVA